MAANPVGTLKEARKSLSRASRHFEEVYQSQPEFSLAAERVRELFAELRPWLEDYSDEVRGVPPVVQSESDSETEAADGSPVGLRCNADPKEKHGQVESV